MGPKIYFFCELDTPVLLSLLKSEGVLQILQTLHAGVCLATLDFSPERAEAVKLFHQAGIPITAWLLLPKSQGYWSNIYNAAETQARYDEFKAWTIRYDLKWSAVGLDVEPDIQVLQNLLARRWNTLLPNLVKSTIPGKLSKARRMYKRLAENIHADGYLLETYQLPLVVDDRLAHSKMIERLLGIFDLASDREVLMLYSSFLRSWGAGILWSYGLNSKVIGVGSTGGGVPLPGELSLPLTWEDFQRDLRLAWGSSEYIYIFSLEGCHRQGFLERLIDFEWDLLLLEPLDTSKQVDRIRLSVQVFLWIFSHYYLFLGFGLIIALLLYPRKRIKGGS